MSFLYPQFLYALLFLAVPIIIHFFNFRRYRRIDFTNVRFLEKASKKNRSFNNLKNLLVLLLRMIAITCLVIAFAQPVDNGFDKDKLRARVSSVYIDNSFSMGLKNADGDLLELAKRKATELSADFKESDLVHLIHNANLSNDDFIEASLFRDDLSRLSFCATPYPLSKVVQIQQDLLTPYADANKQLFLFSDFQKNTSDFENFKTDSTIDVFVIPLQSNGINNLSIDSVWLEQEVVQVNQIAELKVRVKNFGSETRENQTIKVVVDGIQKAIQSFSIDANATAEVNINYKVSSNGWNKLQIVVDDYPIEYDNTFFLSFYVKEKHKILIVNGDATNGFINSVYKTEPNFKVVNQSEGSIEYSSLNSYDLIILNEIKQLSSGLQKEVLNFVQGGGNVLFLPSKDMDLNLSREFLNSFNSGYGSLIQQKQTLSKPQLEHGFFKNVFENIPSNTQWPSVNRYYLIRSATANLASETLIALNNGDDFLTVNKVGNGNFFTIACPINKEFTNLFSHALFVPLMFKYATYSSDNQSNTGFIGRDNFSIKNSLQNVDDVFYLTGETEEFIPRQRQINGRIILSPGNELTKAGFYDLKLKSAGDSLIATVALNYSRDESNLDVYSDAEIQQLALDHGYKLLNSQNGELGAELRSISNGGSIWRYFILAALLSLLLEVVAIKFLKR